MSFIKQNQKKKPPPRPPPPNLSRYRSKSTFNLHQQQQSQDVNLIEWSPPNTPKPEVRRPFGGSVSSSFSSSTSSLASSKKSYELDSSITNNLWPVVTQSNEVSAFKSYLESDQTRSNSSSNNVPSIFGPTIIRARVKQQQKNDNVSPTSGSPPMPSIPPPSPPKDVTDVETPYGIALYDFPATQRSDLSLQIGDVVCLIRRINDEWLFGRVLDREGMFPESFIDIQVPLPEEENIVTVLYNFQAQMNGDLDLRAGQKVMVTKKINDDWLFGECNGKSGQFPCNFVNRVPKSVN